MVQQERAARTRESVLRAAAEVFAEEGFVPATISRISRRAGVSAGALHFHFAGKQALARAVEAAALAAVHRITGQADAEHGGALQRLIAAEHALMRAVEQDAVVRAGFHLVGPAPWRTDPLDLRGAWQRWVESLLHAARREKTLAPEVVPAKVAALVVAATVGFASLGLKDPAWISRRTLERYWDLLLPRLTPGPPAPHQDGPLPHQDGRPPHQDGRPPHRDGRPPHRGGPGPAVTGTAGAGRAAGGEDAADAGASRVLPPGSGSGSGLPE
ncbi:ScbR family autoregulator-binding transcription factor [Streptomyces sp. NPDC047123]|uniref:ScbR family autoregulator-binding transcription factor n=1 Tax=Streptomyces sp. NPDC047123 TaxID=3155622 RepID=UPI0033D0F307